MLEPSKRLLGKPIPGKLTNELIVIVAEHLNTTKAALSLGNCFIFVIAFSGLMRCNESIQVTKGDVAIFSDHK